MALTPKSLLLQLLSAGTGQSLAVEGLIAVGELFGFKSNAVRVALARLTKDLSVESDERGLYRIRPLNNPKQRWVSEWSQGRKRTRKWDGSYLSASLKLKSSSREKTSSLKALNNLGFAEGFPDLWVRPNNLKTPLDELRQLLHAMGLTRECEIFVAKEFRSSLLSTWPGQLWDLPALNKTYRQLLNELEKSHKKLQMMPMDQALVESFALGGKVIGALARDPLLPEEFGDISAYEKLTQAMLNYDQTGRKLWAERLSDFTPDTAPVRLSLVETL